MAKKFLVNLDLAKNQILNAAIQNLPSAPSSPVRGQVYFNTNDSRIYFWDGMNWIDMSGDIRDVIGGAGLTAGTSSGIVTLDINVDNQTIEVSAIDQLQVRDGGITTAKIANLSTDLTINSQSTALATAEAIKSYVDSVVGGLGNLEGGWNVAGYSSFPTTPISGPIKKGDYWYSTSAGVVNGLSGQVPIEIGDVFIALTDFATYNDNSQWLVLQVNKDQATEDNLGLVRIADQITVDNGSDDTEAITPLKLKTYLDNRVGGYAANIGNGFDTTYVVSHGLGTADVIVSLRETISGDEVFADISIAGGSSVYVTFATPPSYEQYRIVIKK